MPLPRFSKSRRRSRLQRRRLLKRRRRSPQLKRKSQQPRLRRREQKHRLLLPLLQPLRQLLPLLLKIKQEPLRRMLPLQPLAVPRMRALPLLLVLRTPLLVPKTLQQVFKPLQLPPSVASSSLKYHLIQLPKPQKRRRKPKLQQLRLPLKSSKQRKRS